MGNLKATVEQCLAAYNRHDAQAFASFFAEHGLLRVVATGEANEGRVQIRAGAEERWRALDYRLETRGIYESGRDVWLEWTMTGVHVGDILGIPATRRRVEGLLGCSHFRFDSGGSIESDLVYFDSATLFNQLGLMPDVATTEVTA